MKTAKNIAAAWAITATVSRGVSCVASVAAVAFVVIGGGDLSVSWNPALGGM